MIAKPSYGTTKRYLWISQVLAWLMIIAVTAGGIAGLPGALAMAPTVYPSMLGLIVLMLGIHRGLGSLDMWTMTKSPSSPNAYDARDQPAGEVR